MKRLLICIISVLSFIVFFGRVNIVKADGPVFGCTDPSAINYNPSATQDDGSCSRCAVGEVFDVPSQSCVTPTPPPDSVLGCTDPSATNYNPAATQDDGSCLSCPPGKVYNPNNSLCEDSTPPPDPVLGCTDPSATNYNPAATQEDGSCNFSVSVPEFGVVPGFVALVASCGSFIFLKKRRS